MGLFSDLKNSAVSAVAKKFIADYLKKYGELQELRIEPGVKQIKLKFLLRGEIDSVSIFIKDYSIIKNNGKTFIKIGYGDSNKEWLTRLMQDFVVEKSIEVPDQYYSYIKLLL